ncbi:type IV pilin protein [Paraburkholderia sp. PREW-6R]|uniref:type IV pilin protein n=1 Tax=Paraburkholderia sp. PREW-6R TaxID=3141544 RepID=UPI0031F4CC2E
MRTATKGFTLLELVITLAIIATLAVFAVPAYRSHVARTHRIDAAAALYRAAQFVEQAASSAVSALPPGMDQAPQFGAPIYLLRVLPANDTNGGYSIEAAPSEAGPARDDVCGIFTLDATGQRGNRNSNTGANAIAPSSGECWNTN